jgi:phosphate transport system permease protein
MASAASAVEHALPPPRPGLRALLRKLASGDQIAHLITLLFAASILLITCLLVYQLWIKSHVARDKFGWHFFFTSVWDPVFGQFGALPFIYGTLLTSALALLIAVPLGLGAAIFLAELAPRRISDGLAFLIDLLAAVPSVIYGLLGIFIVVPMMRTNIGPALKATFGYLPFFQGPNYGVGFLTAGIVLAIMVVPFIISVSREVLMIVPRDQREAALALGATRWESTWRVVVPFAKTGILGSIFLALARALGETMAVTMVIGNDPRISASLFAPGYSIAAVIANEFSEATGDLYIHSLVLLGLVLFLLTFILNGLARLLILATAQRGGAHE